MDPHQAPQHLSLSLPETLLCSGLPPPYTHPPPPLSFPSSRLPPQQLLPTDSPSQQLLPHLPSPSFLAPAPPLLRVSLLPSPSSAAPCPRRRSPSLQSGPLGAEAAAARAASCRLPRSGYPLSPTPPGPAPPAQPWRTKPGGALVSGGPAGSRRSLDLLGRHWEHREGRYSPSFY